MLAGHCDEIGMLVTGIDEDCNIRFVQSGTLNPKMIAGQKVVVYGYSGKQIKGIIACHNGIRDDSIKLSDCYIDCGFDDVKKLMYVNADLYHYYIGREGQSVNEQTMVKRIDQQLFVTKNMIDLYNECCIITLKP